MRRQCRSSAPRPPCRSHPAGRRPAASLPPAFPGDVGGKAVGEDRMRHRRDLFFRPAEPCQDAACLFCRKPRGLRPERRAFLDGDAVMQQHGRREDLRIAAFARLDLQRILEDPVDMGKVMRAVIAFGRVIEEIGGERFMRGKVGGGEKGGQDRFPVEVRPHLALRGPTVQPPSIISRSAPRPRLRLQSARTFRSGSSDRRARCRSARSRGR